MIQKKKDVYQESLVLHEKHGGKIEVTCKVPLKNKKDLSLAYTPGVAEISRAIAKDPDLAKTLTLKKSTILVVSDGSAILGLGNLGALSAIPVMEGKAAIFKKFGGVDAFPICLDTQDTEEIIRTIKLIAPVFGAVNLEDFSAPRCFEIEERLRKELDIPVMHDDQWGTATVLLAATTNAAKVRGCRPQDLTVVFSGVGAAGVACGRIFHAYGITKTIFCDSKGIIHPTRLDLTKEKSELLKNSTVATFEGTLADALLGADMFVGLSKPGIITQDMVRSMVEDPIIFAMANPIPEIMPDLAKEAGALIVGTGRSDFANQINNSLGFPGLFRAVLKKHIPQFRTEMFTIAAEAIASCVKKPIPDCIILSMFDKKVVKAIYDSIH
jgi:malate dehydrogenase (oxaloacetate-decarboxylating)